MKIEKTITSAMSRSKMQKAIFKQLLKEVINEEITEEFRFHPTRRWRFDYAYLSKKIAIEIEGGIYTKGRHINPEGFMADLEKYNQATLLGWRLLRTTPEYMNRKETIEMIKELYNK